MTNIQLIGFIGMIAFYMFGFYSIVNIFNKKKDGRENIALLKAMKSAIIAIFFALFLLIILYMGYDNWTVPSGCILLVLAGGMLIMIMSYKINLSEKAFVSRFLEGKSKEQKRKILTHLSEAFAIMSFVFVVIMLVNEMKHPHTKGSNLYFLGFCICIFLEVYISSKIPKKKKSDEERLKDVERKKITIIIASVLIFVTISASVVAFLINHK
ncbi:MAG: hypothetical protein K0S30_2304 [Clostridia bacterium]|jgi:glucan phosphoethanolaminetransferase (alkaline phosphatase superfamily)|nr:hypothetical protein [Clostridia bacterium]